MTRRSLWTAMGGVLAGGSGFWAGRRRKPSAFPCQVSPSPQAGEFPYPLHPNFSREDALRELGVSELAAPSGCQVVAYNFPSWHPSPVMEKFLGAGWTEFETLKRARALFPGHLFPKRPLWGYFNEADPAWAEKEIDLAARYGVDVWMVDWYWHSGTMFYHEQIEKGLLKAANRSKLKFAVMWANHDWLNVYPASSLASAPLLLPQAHSVEDCIRVIDYCIEHYFHESTYWRLNGALVFGIYDLHKLHQALGMDGLQRAFDGMRERVHKAGLGELHLQANQVHGRLEKDFSRLGIQSATLYHTFGWTYGGRPPGGVSPYYDGAIATLEAWKRTRNRCSVPFFPDCPVGWDDSPRFGASAHVVIGRTPGQYEQLLRAARHFVAGIEPKVVFLSTWNEWTEDHVLLPDEHHGSGYLEAVRRAFS